MRILVFQHTEEEGAGTLLGWAESRGHEILAHHWYRPSSGPEPSGADWLVLLGGPMSVDQEVAHPWLKDEKAFLRAWLTGDRPLLGICLGGQLLAQALGGTVARSTQREIGFHRVLRGAESHPSLARWPGEALVYQYHEDSFSLPPGCASLLTSPACPHQAFARDAGTVGLQFHPESTREWILGNARGISRRDDEPFVQEPAETEALLPSALPPMTESFHQFLDDFVAGWR